MKLKWIVLFSYLSLMCPTLALAIPPSEINLKYDLAKQVLHIEIKHVTNNPQKHRIRKVIIVKNNQAPLDFTYASQTSNTTLLDDVALSAKSGDRILVKAICSKAGNLEQTIIVAPSATK